MKRKRPNLLWVGLLWGIAYWMLESLLHAYVFDGVPFHEAFLGEHDPNELWMRTIVTGLLPALGWVSERFVRSERQEKERVLKLNRLLNYIHQMSALIGDKFQKPLRPESHLEPMTVEGPLLEEGEIGDIVQAVRSLSRYLDTRIDGLYAILELTHEINKGLLVDDVLTRIYETFRSVIPYNRIGVALLEKHGQVLTACWARSEDGESQLPVGYSAPMAGSSLQRIIETGEPRILNDLTVYFKEHPQSRSTKLILAEGIRSSLTCPLIAMGQPIGFIFFSSRETGTYQNMHSDIFKLIAGQLSVVIERSHMYEQLVKEKEKSESLLLNVMPDRIINRIKAGDQNPVEEIPEVGILFADIVDFTQVAARHPAESVLQFLQDVFTQLDHLCERYGVEKVKTIGDAYMVYAYVNSSNSHGLLNLARFALDILSTASRIRYPDGRPLQVRIGLHTGPVIAGVIGQKKFAYDMWGDTVNVAQRLEATGTPGQVHVTENIYSQLKDELTFEPRGEVDLKGKGRLSTYFMMEKRTD